MQGATPLLARPQRALVPVFRGRTAPRRRGARSGSAQAASEEHGPEDQVEACVDAKPFERIEAPAPSQERHDQSSSDQRRDRQDLISAPRGKVEGVRERDRAFGPELSEHFEALPARVGELVRAVLARVPDDPELALDLKSLIEHPNFVSALEDGQLAVLERLVGVATSRRTRRALSAVAVSHAFRTLGKKPRDASLELFRSGPANRHARLAEDLCRLFEHAQFRGMISGDKILLIQEYGRQLTDPEARSALFAVGCSPNRAARRELFRLLRSERPQSFRELSAPIQGLVYRLLARHQGDAAARRVLAALIATPGFATRKAREQFVLISDMFGANLDIAKQWMKSFRPARAGAKPRASGSAEVRAPRRVAEPSTPSTPSTAVAPRVGTPMQLRKREKLTVRVLSGRDVT